MLEILKDFYEAISIIDLIYIVLTILSLIEGYSLLFIPLIACTISLSDRPLILYFLDTFHNESPALTECMVMEKPGGVIINRVMTMMCFNR